MYYVCFVHERMKTPVNGQEYIVVEALESFQGQRVEEDQLRFALDVYAQELDGNSWGAFKKALPDLLAAKVIIMDQREIEKLQDEAIGAIKEVIAPLKEAVKGDIMGTLEALEERWDVKGLSWGVANIAEKRVVANLFKMAKDDKTCMCGHHERAHRPEHGGDPTERRCRLCSGSRGNKVCNNFRPAGRQRGW